MASKKKILKSSNKSNDKYYLYGIVSSVNDYRLAWLINNKLNIELKKINDLEINILNIDELVFYSRYSIPETSDITLLSNKNSNSVKLLPLDFDFILRVNTNNKANLNIKYNLNQISDVILIADIESIKKIPKKLIEKLNYYFCLF